jgi:hypothetical protein
MIIIEPSIGASYQILVHLAIRFQRRRFFRNQPIRNKNCLWWPCLLTDPDKMSNLYRGPSIDASYQVSVHLEQTWLPQKNVVSDWPIFLKSSLKPLGQMNHNLVGSIYGRLSIKNALFVPIRYQTWNQKQELPLVAIFVNRSKLNEQSL